VKKNAAIYKKTLSIIGNVVLILAMAIGLLLTVSILPIRGNFRILSVISGSMEPTIKTGSLIVVKPADEYKQGDIITFRSTDAKQEKDNTTHRISAVEEVDGFVEYKTKGDANEVEDSDKVKLSQIIGKHLFSINYLGFILLYIKTLPGLLILIMVPATIIIYEEVKKIKTEIGAVRDKKTKQGYRTKRNTKGANNGKKS
jgi:signal peptidase